MRITKEAGRPFPCVSGDEVIDYLVTEAVVFKLLHENKEMEKEQQQKDWQKDQSGFDELRRRAGA